MDDRQRAQRRDWGSGAMYVVMGLTWFAGLLAAYSYGNGGDFPITLGMAACAVITVAVNPVVTAIETGEDEPPPPLRKMLPFIGLAITWAILLPLLPQVIAQPTPLVFFASLAALTITGIVGSALAARYTSGTVKVRWTTRMMMCVFGFVVIAITTPIAYYIGLVF